MEWLVLGVVLGIICDDFLEFAIIAVAVYLLFDTSGGTNVTVNYCDEETTEQVETTEGESLSFEDTDPFFPEETYP